MPPTVFLPRPKVESALVAIAPAPVPAGRADVDRDRLFALVRAGFGQRRKMLRRSLAGLVDAGDVRRRRHPPEARAPRSSTSTTGAAWPAVRVAAPDDRRDDRSRAPAKLTLSLRVTGVRADGYHLLDAEMVTLTWPTR